jgi:AraC-like DNA-binding protein
LEYVHLLLKNTRLNQGIGTDKVAFDLCLTERQIHSIENNLKDFFYSPELKLVSIKKYARYLGLDENVVIYQEENLSKTSNETHEAVTEISMSEEVVNDKLDDVVTVSSNATKNIKQNKLYRDDLVRHPIIILGVDYIKNHLTHKITLTDLVRETGYSERSIQLIFNKHFNLSPYEYIEEERLLRAKALIQLHKQNRKIADIAQDAGLMHLGRFSVNFKRRFGLSPSELAKS